jgi:multisubunit Na+/H+ antiporter MnhF subunit
MEVRKLLLDKFVCQYLTIIGRTLSPNKIDTTQVIINLITQILFPIIPLLHALADPSIYYEWSYVISHLSIVGILCNSSLIRLLHPDF